jgi:hypothetical protein
MYIVRLKEFTSKFQVLAGASIKQFQHGDLSGDHCLTNSNTINTITQYIRQIPLDAYSMGQKSLHQNFKYWKAHEHS